MKTALFLFHIPLFLSLLLIFSQKTSYTSKISFQKIIKSELLLAQEIIREPKILPKWLNFAKDSLKEIKMTKKTDPNYPAHNAIFTIEESDFYAVVKYNTDKVVNIDGYKHYNVKSPSETPKIQKNVFL